MWNRIQSWWQNGRRAEDAWQAGFNFGLMWVYGSGVSPEPPERFVGRAAAQWRSGFQVGHNMSVDEAQLEIHRGARSTRVGAHRRSS